MKTIFAMTICLSLFAVGCGPKTPIVKPSTPGSAEPEKTEEKPDTSGGSAY